MVVGTPGGPVAEDAQRALPIFVISDSTGETAEKVVRAALRQFRGHLVHVQLHGDVTTMEQLHLILRRCRRSNGMLVTTLVSSEMRKQVKRFATDKRMRHIDLLGALLDAFEGYLDDEPAEVPGLIHEVDEQYFRRIEAVEFTVKADDGKEPRMLRQADIVLVGVSRTSKTPLSTFLAHKGFKVGNVPLVLDQPPPRQLFEVEQTRVFALTIDPEILRDIRDARLRAMGLGPGTNYSDLDYILAELEYARDLYRGNPEWPVIDVTNKALEETAATILRLVHERGFIDVIGDVGQLG
jgi:regulator of PEP synthase PpsR (kinase-PPPase family)